MPYAKRTLRRTRRVAFRRRRVAIAPRKKKTVRGFVRKNALVNRKQSRQIASIKKQLHGRLQMNLQQSILPITINNTQPMLWDCTDFTSQRSSSTGASQLGCRIYQVNNALTDTMISGHFTTASFSQNVYWRNVNKDIIDGGSYLPVCAVYTLDVSCRTTTAVAPPKFMVHLFQQKAGFFQNASALPNQNAQNRIMPQGLVHLQKMADINENAFNKMYFKVYKVQAKFLNKHTSAASGSSMTANYQFKFVVRPKKARYQADTAPDIPGTVDNETTDTAGGTYGLLNVDPRTPLWAMCSASTRPGDTNQVVSVKIMRKCYWRDPFGSARLL